MLYEVITGGGDSSRLRRDIARPKGVHLQHRVRHVHLLAAPGRRHSWPATPRPPPVITSYSIHYTKLYDSSKVFKMAEYHVERVEFLLELCSEIVGYNENWRSDVSLAINGKEIGIIECPGDHGERRGRLNPGWWPENATQFGDLHHIAITQKGCLIDSHLRNNFV